jgi:Bacterial type III secretion protein (HrpB4)
MQNTDNAMIDPAVATQIAIAAGAKLSNLVPEIHPAWLKALRAPFNLVDSSVFSTDLLGDALLEQFELRWPDLSALTHPLQALWLLPKKDIVHFCQSWAIFERRSQLSRCMDSSVRRRIRQLVGERVFEKILQVPFRPEETGGTSVPVEPDGLAVEGFNALRQLYPSTDSRHWRIAAMSFAPNATEPNDIDGAARGRPKTGRFEFIELGAELFPEHAWLFGLKLGSRQ